MNEILAMIDNAIDQLEQEDTFQINDDLTAEWSLKKIKEDRAEKERLIKGCKDAIAEYQIRMKKLQEELDNPSYLELKLQEYFFKVPHKTSKSGTETYALPSGKLKLKPQQPEYKRDEVKLLQWLKDREMSAYIKVTESPQWGELKKAVVQHDNKVCYDGEIVDGITLLERDPVFEVDI